MTKLGYRVEVLTDAQATGGEILKAIQNYGQFIDQDEGTFLFAFSGHGFASEHTQENYIAPYEVAVGDIDKYGVKLTDVVNALKATGAKRQLLLIDACRDNPKTGSRNAPGGRSFINFSDTDGHAILFSTKFGGKSWEYSDLNHGVFTYYVIEALRGAARGQDGNISFRELAGYVRKKVKDYGQTKRNIQVPYVKGEWSGDDFLIASIPQRIVSPPPPKPDPAPVVENTPAPQNIRHITEFQNTEQIKQYFLSQMQRVPGGCLSMGEKKKERVCLDSYLIGRFEVTNRAFFMFWEYMRKELNKDLHDGSFVALPQTGGDRRSQCADCPVTRVSYSEVERFIQWLTRATGLYFRLPTEAQWEYACRGGVSGQRYCGSDDIFEVANTSRPLQPVGNRRPNGFNLYDMSGNAEEWTCSKYASASRMLQYIKSCSGGRNNRVIRGGAIGDDFDEMMASSRSIGAKTNGRNSWRGFRLVLPVM